jgi:RNA polymerase sigma factor (sigma-70 family)
MAYNRTRVLYLLKQERTKENIEELIVLNFGLINKQLFKFYLVNDPDALSYGYEALYNAIMTYDSKKNTEFSTYAMVCIYNRMGSHVRSINTAIIQNTTSYEEPVDEHGNSLIGMLESNLTADGKMIDACNVSNIYSKFVECYNKLGNPLHKRIIRVWVGSEFTMTHVKIAEASGCTQTYVSQVLKKFKHKLEVSLSDNF